MKESSGIVRFNRLLKITALDFYGYPKREKGIDSPGSSYH